MKQLCDCLFLTQVDYFCSVNSNTLSTKCFSFVTFKNTEFVKHLFCTELKQNRKENVFVSKLRGTANYSSCGSQTFPCKTLQHGLDILSWGGQLNIDGEGTEIDPYSCESTSGKILVLKSLIIQSYTRKARIYHVHMESKSKLLMEKQE